MLNPDPVRTRCRVKQEAISGLLAANEAPDLAVLGVKAGNTATKKAANARSRRGTRQRERDQLVLAKHFSYDAEKVVEALLIDGRYLKDPDADQETVETALSKFMVRIVGWVIARSKE